MRGDSIISEVLTMTPLFVIEEPGEWRIEVYDDGSARYVDFFEDISEIMFGVDRGHFVLPTFHDSI